MKNLSASSNSSAYLIATQLGAMAVIVGLLIGAGLLLGLIKLDGSGSGALFFRILILAAIPIASGVVLHRLRSGVSFVIALAIVLAVILCGCMVFEAKEMKGVAFLTILVALSAYRKMFKLRSSLAKKAVLEDTGNEHRQADQSSGADVGDPLERSVQGKHNSR